MFSWFEKVLAQQAEGALRHFLSGVGGAFVAKGVMTQDQNQAIVGGIVALAAVGWSAYQKSRAAKQGAVARSEGPLGG